MAQTLQPNWAFNCEFRSFLRFLVVLNYISTLHGRRTSYVSAVSATSYTSMLLLLLLYYSAPVVNNVKYRRSAGCDDSGHLIVRQADAYKTTQTRQIQRERRGVNK